MKKIIYQYWNTTGSWHMFLMDEEGYCIKSESKRKLSDLLGIIEKYKIQYNIIEVKKIKANEFFSCQCR